MASSLSIKNIPSHKEIDIYTSMGKLDPSTGYQRHHPEPVDGGHLCSSSLDAPICECNAGGLLLVPPDDEKFSSLSSPTVKDDHSTTAPKAKAEETTSDSANMPNITGTVLEKELVVIGAGPHALSLILRLLEPDADLLSDKERHERADFLHRDRPVPQVRVHAQAIAKGFAYFQTKQAAKMKQLEKKKKKMMMKKKKSTASKSSPSPPPPPPPPPPMFSLQTLKEQVMVVDASAADSQHSLHGWLGNWDSNFDALGIDRLRSPIGAHGDPFDHRALEFYAEAVGRSDELIPMRFEHKRTGRWDYHGPYNVPSTALFSDFHKALIEAYGLDDGFVQAGRVEAIDVTAQDNADAKNDGSGHIFTVHFRLPCSNVLRVVKAKQVVMAMGPSAPPKEIQLQNLNWIDFDDMATIPTKGILSNPEILQVLQVDDDDDSSSPKEAKNFYTQKDILIVGGGITSGHMVLQAFQKLPNLNSITLIQRSPTLVRQFDLPDEWMGPGRGRLLEKGYKMEDLKERLQWMQQERKGGSMSPEVYEALKQLASVSLSSKKHHSEPCCPQVHLLDCVEIDRIEAYETESDSYRVSLLDHHGTTGYDLSSKQLKFHQIWMATGFPGANSVNSCPLLQSLMEPLALASSQEEGGVPLVHPDLSCPTTSKQQWKQSAASQLYLMGPLASLELGPDALNWMGARQGAVRIATSLRRRRNNQ